MAAIGDNKSIDEERLGRSEAYRKEIIRRVTEHLLRHSSLEAKETFSSFKGAIEKYFDGGQKLRTALQNLENMLFKRSNYDSIELEQIDRLLKELENEIHDLQHNGPEEPPPFERW